MQSVMTKEETDFFRIKHFKLTLIFSLLWISLISSAVSLSGEAIFLNASPVTIKKIYPLYRNNNERDYIGTSRLSFKRNVPVKNHHASNVEIFQIHPSDAIIEKYSQPDIDYQFSSYPANDMEVPSSPHLKETLASSNAQYLSPASFLESSFSSSNNLNTITSQPFSDFNDFIDSSSNNAPQISEFIVKSEYKAANNPDMDKATFQATLPQIDKDISYQIVYKNNLTDRNDSLHLASSNSFFSLKTPLIDSNDSIYNDTFLKQNNERSIDERPNLNPDQQSINISGTLLFTMQPTLKSFISDYPSLATVVFDTYSTTNYINETDGSEKNLEYVTTDVTPSLHIKNVSDSLPSIGNDKSNKLSSGIVAGIVIAVLVCVTILSSAVIYLLYRRYNGKCASVVESKFNSDNCGYLDDSLRSSMYLNNHIELPKENSEEMTSLDNDSFLNSLETMTIQNYWADNSKNTKV